MLSTTCAIVLALTTILVLGLAANRAGRSRTEDRIGVHVF